jgi:hypothetical protein
MSPPALINTAHASSLFLLQNGMGNTSHMVWNSITVSTFYLAWVAEALVVQHDPPGDKSSRPDEQVQLEKLIYIAWNIWKKRCQRVFDNKTLAHGAHHIIIKQDVQQWHMAWNLFQGPVQSSFVGQ